MLDGTYYFECDCGADAHTLRFTLDKDPEYPCIYTSVFLNQHRTWWRRVWTGMKYVFGYKCRYGHWDRWVMRGEDATKLRSMCDDFMDPRE